MSCDNDTDDRTSLGGRSGPDTPSIARLNQSLGLVSAHRMLTEAEIELLRQSKREVIEVTRAVLASMGDS